MAPSLGFTAVATEPIEGQKPGTSGLRKKVRRAARAGAARGTECATMRRVGGDREAPGCAYPALDGSALALSGPRAACR